MTETPTTSIIPCGHHLVVQPIKLPEKSKGGIILVIEGSQQDKLERAGRMIGVILAIGPQCWKAHAATLADFAGTSDPWMYAQGDILGAWASVGDTVLYSRHAGKFVFDPMDTEVKGRDLYLIHDDDVLAKLPAQEEWALDYDDIAV